MNESDLNKMEAGARAATQGEWKQSSEDGGAPEITGSGWRGPRVIARVVYDRGSEDPEVRPNARHIANCSPPTIISMINDIRNLRKELAKKNTELFHTEQATGCQAHEMGSIAPCTCRREMGG